MIDTHCHLNFDSYDVDRSAVITRAAAAGVTHLIAPAVDLETSQQVIHLAEQYAGVYAAVGIHPNDTATIQEADISQLESLARHSKVVAIGEIGLDYYWDKSPKAVQAQALQSQLALAKRLELPVIIHNREASEDVMAALESWTRDLPTSLRDRAGVLHSFSGSAAIAERALTAGFYLGFTGPITYKKADELRRIAAGVPLHRILVETDGPFLTPIPHRGERNEPAYIPYIVDRLAALKQISPVDMARITAENAERLFRLDARR